jgi:hypothetical protein
MGISTSCEKCVFATFLGGVQNGCELGRLQKLQSLGVETVLTIPQGYEGDEYYLIKDRVCNACTQESTLKGVPERKWESEVLDRIKTRINMGVYVGPNDTFDAAIKTIDSILWQHSPPLEMKVLLHGPHSPGDYIPILKEKSGKIDWSVQEIVLDDADYGTAINLAMEQIKATYYTVSKAGYEYHPDYVYIIDRAINDDLQRFVALLPDQDGNAGLIQRGLHKMIGGNRGMPVLEKIGQIADEEKTGHMIKRFEDL